MSHRATKAALTLAALLAGTGGCLVDQDAPCSPNQVELEGPVAGCVCAENSVLSADGSGCTACGAHEVVKSGQCACSDGFARIDGTCLPSALGSACDAQTPCAAPYAHCAEEGYCTTSGCTSNQECTSDHWCDRSGETSFCRKPPTGLGKACTVSADCVGLEAGRCASGSCQVGGCAAPGASACFSDYVCCDYSALAASIGDICVPPSSLMAGKCAHTGADPVVQP